MSSRRRDGTYDAIAIVVCVFVWVWFFLGCTPVENPIVVEEQKEIAQLKGIVAIQDTTIAAQKHSIDMLEGIVVEKGKLEDRATKVLLQCGALADRVIAARHPLDPLLVKPPSHPFASGDAQAILAIPR